MGNSLGRQGPDLDEDLLDDSEDDNDGDDEGCDEVEIDDDEIVAPRGLQNLGNTCYLNSVVQALSSSSVFIGFLRRENRKIKMNCRLKQSQASDNDRMNALALRSHFNERGGGLTSDSSPKRHYIFARKLLQLLDEMLEREDGDPTYPLSPSDLRAYIVSHNASFAGNGQQDALEVIQAIFQLITEEYRVVNARSGLKALLPPGSCFNRVRYGDSKDINNNSLRNTSHSSKRIDIINNDPFPFEGFFYSNIECLVCKNKRSFRHSSFTSISLAIPSDDKRISLESCLKRYFDSELVDDVDCSRCALKAFCELAGSRAHDKGLERQSKPISLEKTSNISSSSSISSPARIQLIADNPENSFEFLKKFDVVGKSDSIFVDIVGDLDCVYKSKGAINGLSKSLQSLSQRIETDEGTGKPGLSASVGSLIRTKPNDSNRSYSDITCNCNGFCICLPSNGLPNVSGTSNETCYSDSLTVDDGEVSPILGFQNDVNGNDNNCKLAVISGGIEINRDIVDRDRDIETQGSGDVSNESFTIVDDETDSNGPSVGRSLQHLYESLETSKDVISAYESLSSAIELNSSKYGLKFEIPRKKSRIRKSMAVSRFPGVLAIHLIRLKPNSYGLMTKVNTPVSFPLTLYPKHFESVNSNNKTSISTNSSNSSNSSNSAMGGRINISDLLSEVGLQNTSNNYTFNNTNSSINSNNTSSASNTSGNNSSNNLSSGELSPCFVFGSFLYSLIAVVVHHGSADSGHYTTYRLVGGRQGKPVNTPLSSSSSTTTSSSSSSAASSSSSSSSQGQWYMCSDTQVFKVTEAQVMQSQAYMLLYERVATTHRSEAKSM